MAMDSYSISRELLTEAKHLGTDSNYSLMDNCVLCIWKTAVTPAYVALYVLAILVVIITVCGNLLVITSVCHFRQLHTPTNILLLSLAMADILVGVFVMPLQFICLIESCWIFGTTICAFYNFTSFHLTSVSVHNVALIAVDRYLALSNPFFYSKKVTVNVIIFVASLNWMFSLGYNTVLTYCNDGQKCPTECIIVLNEIWSFVDLMVVFVLPCSIMIVLYLKVFAIAKRHANAIRAANSHVNPGASKTDHVPKHSERKAAKVLGILVSVFLLCLVPYYTCSFLSESIQSKSFNDVLNYMFALLYLNSLFNPIIYALFYPWFQKSIKIMFRCRILYVAPSLITCR